MSVSTSTVSYILSPVLLLVLHVLHCKLSLLVGSHSAFKTSEFEEEMKNDMSSVPLLRFHFSPVVVTERHGPFSGIRPQVGPSAASGTKRCRPGDSRKARLLLPSSTMREKSFFLLYF